MTSQENKATTRKLRRKKILFYSILLFVFLFCTGWFLLDRWSKKYGFTGAGDFVKTVTVNYWSSFDAKYETIHITLSDADYEKLALQREQHLKKGIITKIDDRYVPSIITYNGKKIKCRLRLKGHMTDHLQNKKWSFRIKTIKGDAFKGMKIFSLMHPGTRNYIYEWIYHQLLEQEGIATVRYSFLNLKVNGESWGVYALEENFADELLEHSRLPDGPVFGFNPDLYWYARLNEFERKAVDIENKQFNASYPEAYNEEDLLKNERRRKDYAEALVKMQRYMEGKIKTSDVFDIEKLAKFHAVLDLVGGQFSLDWSDVKYYYNPVTQKIEPVGYESFSVRNTAQLCGAYLFRNDHAPIPELHELIFSDNDFFKLYVENLIRLSNPAYLNDFFKKQNAALNNNLAILYSEFPYKKLSIKQYYINQENIKTLLKAPLIPVFYLEKVKDDTLIITAGCNNVLPLEIVSVRCNDQITKLKKPVVLSSRKKNEQIYYETLKVPFTISNDFDKEKIKFTVISPGTGRETVLEVKPLEFEKMLEDFEDVLAIEPNYKKFDFLTVDESEKIITFKNGEHYLTENLIFPEGYEIIAIAPCRLILNNNSCIISRSAMNFSGSGESPIEITTSDSTGKGIILISAESASRFKNINFVGLNFRAKKSDSHKAIVCFYESDAHFSGCHFSSESPEAISSVRNKLKVYNSSFFNMKENVINCLFSEADMTGCKFYNASDKVLVFEGSHVGLRNIIIDNCGNGIVAKNGSTVNGNTVIIKNSVSGIKASDNSLVKIRTMNIQNLSVGFSAEKKSDVFGPAMIKITGLKKSKIKSLTESDKKSKIEID